ncbi:MAG: tRNA (adenosine(37)-N6)-threonylcarbamoyltransferase complex transferase subunit TsaD [Nitrospiraceae bacterium]|nr:tRNA (adenosine(37)-N6)-threonylcarbamoyltransferase complex transferase subunit TsaD [Nitrospiraceae bacterium]MDA8089757.1 tRNA (adenosine(37)-N6)-threonylcarbamoyltransferase complex transferase subunit TsaD [Nitrospiraceae bacterium]
MLVLGIDTSCDDTSAALLEFSPGAKTPGIISTIVSSQAGIHSKYGGIVPELASRRHIEMIWPVVREGLDKTELKELSAIAVCAGPGLIGSLLVGCSFAKAVSFSKNIPLVGVNHLEGHVLSAFIENSPEFPFISLVVSGGHTSLYLAKGFCDYTELGKSRDDAAGEAYDKVAKLLSLGYPGGPQIDRLAREGNPKAIPFPRAYLPGSLDFSFSGMKTAVLNLLNGMKDTREVPVNDIAASFQQAVVDVLVRKCQQAIIKTGVKRLALAGGVAANSALKDGMLSMTQKIGAELFIPSPVFCTDNAAMIAVAGYQRLIAGQLSGPDLNPKASLRL